MRRIVILLIAGVLVHSCGPSQKEIEARNKFIEDSISKVEARKAFIQDSIKKAEELAELKRVHLEMIEVGKDIKRNKFENIKKELEADLDKANKKLEEIEEWKLGRPPSERQNQIRDQQLKINEIERDIRRVEKEISLTHLFESFEFQESPSNTVKHIFESAKNRDFSKMRHLIDPYGEFDKEAMWICLVEMFPLEAQDDWANQFKNGRIMSKPVFDDEYCTIEIAIGSNSDKLEKIKLVKRWYRWYVLGM